MSKGAIKVLSISLILIIIFPIVLNRIQVKSGEKTALSDYNQTDSTRLKEHKNPEKDPIRIQKDTVTLTYFYGSPDVAIGTIIGNDPSKVPNIIEKRRLFKEKHGYDIDFEYIFSGQDEVHTKLQLLTSSDELPDLFPAVHEWYPGGPSKAALDGLILNFMDYRGKLPNIMQLIESNPAVAKAMKNDDGGLYCMGDIRIDPVSAVFFGPIIRKDLLDKSNLPIPETIDEWYIALKAFKEQGIPTPLSAISWFWHYSNAFASAWDATGIPNDDGGCSILIDDNDNVVYGSATTGYREFLTTFNRWYSEGLLDLDGITSGNWGAYNAKLLNGEVAGGLHFLAELGNLSELGKNEAPDFSLVATKYPVLNKDEKPRMGQWDPIGLRNGPYVNAKSEQIEACLDYVDIAYSEEGIMLANYGILDKTYHIVDGKPEFTDYIVFEGEKNIDGLTTNQVATLYAGSGSVIIPEVWFMLNTTTKEERDAIPLWSDIVRPAKELMNISFTEEETEIVQKRVDLDAYASEQYISFITGNRPLSEYDAYIEELKTKFKMDEIVTVYQGAYTRYKHR